MRRSSDVQSRPAGRSAVWLSCSMTVIVLALLASTSEAFHFFRGNDSGGCGSGCCPASGELTDDPVFNGVPIHGPHGATVQVFHNTYHDAATMLPLVVRITAGQSIKWEWTSSHCHSVTADDLSFDSGFYYPTNPPAGQTELIHGFLDYPLPDSNPSLSYVHTFNTPGTYLYHCVHHQIIGMVGVVIVDP